MTDRASSVNADGVFEPCKIDDVPVEEYSRCNRFGIRYQGLGHFGGGSHVGAEIVVLEPGRQSYPAHYHMLEEEHLLILEGEVTLRLGDASHESSPGSYACFPAGQKAGHALVNNGHARCRYLIVGEQNSSEVVVYTDSGPSASA